MRVAGSVTVNRPIEQVFSFAANPENDIHWRQGHKTANLLTPRPIGVGTRCQEHLETMGMKGDLTIEFTEYVPNRRIAFKATRFGPMEPRGQIAFEPTAAGATGITFTAEPRVTGLFKLFSPMMGAFARKDINKSLAAMKQHLESR